MQDDPNEDEFWDPAALERDTVRAFELCHSCRNCWTDCESFPNLFAFIDKGHAGDPKALTQQETEQVMDACFQCDRCEERCPYSPRLGHPTPLHFPRLVQRWKAQRVVRRGTTLRERALANPEWNAAAARASLGLVDLARRVPLHRWFLEKALGIHRDKLLTPIAGSAWENKARRAGRMSKGSKGAGAVFFQGCHSDGRDSTLADDALFVLDHHGVDVRCAQGLQCCGRPALEQGDLEGLRTRAVQNLELLLPFVEEGAKVLVLHPRCSRTMKEFWPTLLGREDQERARIVAAAVQDVSEHVDTIQTEGRLGPDAAGPGLGKVGYLKACHERSVGGRVAGRELVGRLSKEQPVTVEECCGHGCVYATGVESFDASRRVGQKSWDALAGHGADIWVTQCPGAAIQVRQHTGREVLHPITVLARAYRGQAGPKPEMDGASVNRRPSK